HVWSGKCRRLEAVDFESRDWIPHSGWPLSSEGLEPFYERAGELIELPFSQGEIRIRDAEITKRLGLAGGPLRTRFYAQSPFQGPRHFGAEIGPTLAAARSCRVILHSVAIEVTTDDSRRVTGVEAGGEPGHRFAVEAPTVVLAAGALENTRLLLLSNRRDPAGLGNHHDQLGRYYTDRRGILLGHVRTRRPELWREFTFYGRVGDRGCSGLVLSDELIRDKKLLNGGTFAYELWPPRYARPQREQSPGFKALLATKRAIRSGRVPPAQTARAAFGGLGEAAELLALRARARVWRDFVVELYPEPLPNPESRLSLSRSTDRLGRPITEVKWRVSDDFTAYVRSYVRLLKEGIAQMDPTVVPDLEVAPDFLLNLKHEGSHHMGTTRMATDPRHGVVDADCQVHTVPGLYVAGSSVFPTSGAANPTLTILALAIRLADHISVKRSPRALVV
ncbi:MAG: hypothetical protein KJO17_13745, partial [Acidimicrobiia bacterium]|nr:hypothetical protein [Acidimicrobiia bacterium]